MWEFIGNVGVKLLDRPLLYILSILIVWFLLKRGLFSINTGAFSLGRTRENERRILSAQINYVTLETETIANEMVNKFPNINPYHTKYVMEKVLDEFVKRITLNHITNDEAYIEDTYEVVLAIVRKRCKNEYFWGEEYEKYCRDKVKHILLHLLDIRNRLSK